MGTRHYLLTSTQHYSGHSVTQSLALTRTPPPPAPALAATNVVTIDFLLPTCSSSRLIFCSPHSFLSHTSSLYFYTIACNLILISTLIFAPDHEHDDPPLLPQSVCCDISPHFSTVNMDANQAGGHGFWRYLINSQKRATPQLEQLCLGIAKIIVRFLLNCICSPPFADCLTP